MSAAQKTQTGASKMKNQKFTVVYQPTHHSLDGKHHYLVICPRSGMTVLSISSRKVAHKAAAKMTVRGW